MDYKLKIFKTVAIARSFSRAARLLHISQPAVSKSVRSLEEFYGKAFFERKPNSIELTAAGEVFLERAERILTLYDELENEFTENKVIPNEIKIGASTSIGNYVLPELLGKIQQDYPDLKADVLIGNTFDIQQAVLGKEINLGIIEGGNHNTRLRYSKFIEDELVLVSRYGRPGPETLNLYELLQLPMVSRETGSGTREVIENAFRTKSVPLPESQTVLGSTESIKSYILNSDALAFLSVHTIGQELRNRSMKIIDIEGFEILRWFFFINRQGYQSKLNSRIQNLLTDAYDQTE